MIKQFISWIENIYQNSQAKYLSTSCDIYQLEARMKQLEHSSSGKVY